MIPKGFLMLLKQLLPAFGIQFAVEWAAFVALECAGLKAMVVCHNNP